MAGRKRAPAPPPPSRKKGASAKRTALGVAGMLAFVFVVLPSEPFGDAIDWGSTKVSEFRDSPAKQAAEKCPEGTTVRDNLTDKQLEQFIAGQVKAAKACVKARSR